MQDYYDYDADNDTMMDEVRKHFWNRKNNE
jgi:hypothetical protein